jgi:uncharacterized protein YkwD
MKHSLTLALVALCLMCVSSSAVFAADAAQSCTKKVSSMNIPKVREARVKKMWLSWINRVRKGQGVPPVAYSDSLTKTAVEWSTESAAKNTISHSRPGQITYYDYPLMVSWFQDRGITFDNVSSTTFTENIGWGSYSCKETQRDCTGSLIRSIRTTLNFFLSEKGKQYRPHYNSIVNPNYTVTGLGIALNAEQNKYFLTVHYGTKVTDANSCPTKTASN